MPTYEGETGRIVGFLWGGFGVTIGASLWLTILDGMNALPSFVFAVVPELLRWPWQPIEGVAFPLFMALPSTGFLVMGGLSLWGALFKSDYSITLTGRGGTP